MSTISQRIVTFRIATASLARNLMVISAALLCLPGPAWSAEPLRIGILLSLSGTMEQEGRKVLRGLKMSRKLKPVVLDRPVQLVVADAQSDPAQAACAMFRLIERDRVSAVIGDVMSSTSTAASHVAERKRVPMVALAGVSDHRHGNSNYFFPIDTRHKQEAFLAAKLCRDRLNAETAVVITDVAQELSIKSVEAFRRSFVRAGGRILGNIRIRTGQTAFDDALSRIVDMTPGVAYAPVFGAECVLLAKQIRNLGLFIPIVSISEAGCEAFTMLDSRAVEGICVVSCSQCFITVAPANTLLPTGTGQQAANISATAMDMVVDAYSMLLDAVERAGSSDPEAIREALVKMREEGSEQIARALLIK